jgi:uncharacterized protein (DUF2164 family)
MAKVKRSWDTLTEEKRKKSINEIIDFFQRERDEKIGIIAAEKILDHFLQDVGVDIYNKGVEDSKQFLKSRFEDIEVDLDAIVKK